VAAVRSAQVRLSERVRVNIMIGADSDRAADSPEEGEAVPLPQAEQVRDGARRPMGIGRLARLGVKLAFGLVLLWGLAVLCLGLSYTVLPPVSSLMLARWATLRPVDRTAVDMEAVSPHLPLAVMAAEDARLCQHGGVDWDALREVVEAADEDGPARGASTIPMQVAKNLFLWPSRSYLRKGLELPIALYIDLVWSKRRMMENYLNIAEWGEGVFGAEAAARRYFRKSAKDLTRREAALLATALPNPFRRNPARPTASHGSRADRLLGRMDGTAPFADCLRG
jgi:monofunctional biosynthetic peptidoglycan transglycosylase